jgi:hypothetical protein
MERRRSAAADGQLRLRRSTLRWELPLAGPILHSGLVECDVSSLSNVLGRRNEEAPALGSGNLGW